jgi:hypothetical protein
MQSDIQLQSANQGLGVASNINDGVIESVATIASTLRDARRKHNDLSSLFDNLENRLQSLQQILSTNTTLINGFRSALRPLESSHRIALANEITDQEDVDHTTT